MPTTDFHPAVSNWFNKHFESPTPVQLESWQAIATQQHTLLAAPTGSGKTLAAFLKAIDNLIKEGLKKGLQRETRILYLSPLKALSNDIQINLQTPLLGIRNELAALKLPDVDINAWVRTGDTPAAERAKAVKNPPHILVTTPESIYILLTSDSGRQMLKTVNTVIIDEIHAVAGNKRGSHLSLSLERLEALVNDYQSALQATQPTPADNQLSLDLSLTSNNQPALATIRNTPEHASPNPLLNTQPVLQRIGLSATQKPIELMANFLIGNRNAPCHIINTGHSRERDLALILPSSPLDAVMSNEIWDEVYNTLEHLCRVHNTTLVFVNTRRLAERVARFIGERIDEENVMAHHGSMSKEKRLKAEQRLKRGELQCLVATASLELGIDIGDVDLVCQLGSPRSIAAFLQRVGRSGHAVNATPKGRLFPLSRDDLVECTALLHSANHDELDRIIIPHQPLDVLAQQLVAEISGREWLTDELYPVITQSWPYRHLTQDTFDHLIQMLADGYSTRRGRRAAYLHYDAVNRRVRARKGARLVALTNGGAIPDQFDCEVILSPEDMKVGTIGEDFAFESMPGDIFQLGNTSYRILKTETGRVFVEDAKGLPPTLPFWLGEAPGRTDELSLAVSNLRREANEHLEHGMAHTEKWLKHDFGLKQEAAEQLTAYLGSSKAALGVIPHQDNIVFERFFDDVGDMHLVIHSPYGSRLNKAWGLSLRKRFCRQFNFELQAAALEDTIVLSLSSSHSFPLEEVAKYLNTKTVRHILIQAMLDAPMFPTRWRWNATIALAVLRNRAGKRTPPYFQRSDAEDLIAILFPDQIACGENIAGDREVPDHPLVNQAIHDCLYETMDIEGLEQMLTRLAENQIKLTCCDLTAPSPLAQEVVNARPYAFLDDGEAEERRTLAVTARSSLNPAEAAELGKLDERAIDAIKQQAWPTVRDADELHDALMLLGFITDYEATDAHQPTYHDTHKPSHPKNGLRVALNWQPFMDELIRDNRATVVSIPKSMAHHNATHAFMRIWVTAERLQEFQHILPQALMEPTIKAIPHPAFSNKEPLVEIIRSRLEGLGPITATQLAHPLGLPVADIDLALLKLEQEGFVVRGQFTSAASKNPQSSPHINAGTKSQLEPNTLEWCERRLLARIHRYTINRLRNEIEPVSIADYMRFLFHWQGVSEKAEGTESVAHVLQQLEGYSVAASAWESEILPARIRLYSSDQLENLCLSGRMSWLRLQVPPLNDAQKRKQSPVNQTPIALIRRQHLATWQMINHHHTPNSEQLSPYAQRIFDTLQQQGAVFFSDLISKTGILRTQVEDALGELVNWGLVTSDSSAGLRALITPAAKRSRIARRSRIAALSSPFDNAGRWSLIERNQLSTQEPSFEDQEELTEFIAHTLLKRYGVICRRVLEKEQNLPPWRDLLKVYWRMEARGEIRGGRFVQGVSGEQFALPDAVGTLRRIQKQEKSGDIITISASDPLNLTGTVLPGEKITSSHKTRIAFRDGIPIASQHNNKIEYRGEPDEQARWDVRLSLMGHTRL